MEGFSVTASDEGVRLYNAIMDQLTIRGTSVNLPLFREEILEMLQSLNPADGLVSRFEFSNASVRALDLKDAMLIDGKIRSVRTDAASMVGTGVRGVEFSNCELGSLHWTGGKISRTRFTDCKLLGAKFENVAMEHVVFTDCKMNYVTLNQVRASGPVMFIRCSLREAEFNGCDMTGSLLDECDLTLATFENRRYAACDFRGNDLSTLRGVSHLRRVIINSAQLVQLAGALAAELEINFVNELNDPLRPNR
jgi:uncharacterized protein YjbI with pentapeptide repeats